jgi:hypothetical protein
LHFTFSFPFLLLLFDSPCSLGQDETKQRIAVAELGIKLLLLPFPRTDLLSRDPLSHGKEQKNRKSEVSGVNEDIFLFCLSKIYMVHIYVI